MNEVRSYVIEKVMLRTIEFSDEDMIKDGYCDADEITEEMREEYLQNLMEQDTPESFFSVYDINYHRDKTREAELRGERV